VETGDGAGAAGGAEAGGEESGAGAMGESAAEAESGMLMLMVRPAALRLGA